MSKEEVMIYNTVLSLVKKEGLYHYDSLRIDLVERINPDSDRLYHLCNFSLEAMVNKHKLLDKEGGLVKLSSSGKLASKVGIRTFFNLRVISNIIERIVKLI